MKIWVAALASTFMVPAWFTTVLIAFVIPHSVRADVLPTNDVGMTNEGPMTGVKKHAEVRHKRRAVFVPMKNAVDANLEAVRIGDKRSVAGLTLQPLEVLEDSRCPAHNVCFWPGILVIKVHVMVGGESSDIFLGNTDGKPVAVKKEDFKRFERRPVVYGGYRLYLVNATPRKDADFKMPPDEYSLDFKIERE